MSKEIKQILSTLKLLTVFSFITILIPYQIAWSNDFKKNAIEVNNPYIYKPFVGARSAAGYLSIRNHAHKDLNLLQVSTALGRAMLHKTTTTDDGVVKMEHLMEVNIRAGDELIMKPGSVHIMIMGISRPLILGEKIPAILKFSEEKEMDIEFTVQELRKHSEVRAQSKHAH